MTTSLVLLFSFAVIVGWGSAYSASRESRAISRMKIAFACLLLVGFFIALAGSRWIAGEEDLSGITLIVWPLATIGMVACLSSVLGKLIGIYRRRYRA